MIIFAALNLSFFFRGLFLPSFSDCGSKTWGKTGRRRTNDPCPRQSSVEKANKDTKATQIILIQSGISYVVIAAVRCVESDAE